MRPPWLIAIWVAGVLALAGTGGRVAHLAAQPAGQPSGRVASGPNGCVTCHSAEREASLSAPVAAHRADVHGQRGIGCVECHGGDATTADKVKAMSAAAGFKGKLTGQAQVLACARCHSDAAYMRTFSPKQRVDQAVEYAASAHGRRLAEGDTRVATCASCHGAHGVRSASDAQSPVYATNVAGTCGSCHSDARRMTRHDGTAHPTAAVADYTSSVHFDALSRRRDLSAPTCNDCHGNHGAAPPGVDAVSNVCGTCHAVFAARFDTSPHKPVFEKACVDCHGNHAVVRPTEALMGTGAGAICVTCHAEKDDPGFRGAAAMRASIDRLSGHIAKAAGVVEQARNAGMEVGDQDLALGKARDQLMLARTDVHTFDPKKVEGVTADGDKVAAEAEAGGRRALEELSFRRRGLTASLVLILAVVGALTLKIRQIDQRRSAAQ
ncbi:MAG: cytochrome c3 family protein [Vicinamibacterales bacterium]